MEYYIIQRVTGWTILWFTLYRTCNKVLCKRQPEYNCRIVTLFHAFVITLLSCYLTFFQGSNPYTVLGLPNTNSQVTCLTISLGYFLYDFLWCLYFRTEGPVMLMHHVVSIIFMAICLHLGISGTEVVATIFGSEITSIFLNVVRWYIV
uniref:TLC domain-containing protein n=1 Tax=Ciona savignyi TaxID=51511 RepID=H2YH13_CIOSA